MAVAHNLSLIGQPDRVEVVLLRTAEAAVCSKLLRNSSLAAQFAYKLACAARNDPELNVRGFTSSDQSVDRRHTSEDWEERYILSTSHATGWPPSLRPLQRRLSCSPLRAPGRLAALSSERNRL